MLQFKIELMKNWDIQKDININKKNFILNKIINNFYMIYYFKYYI